MLSNTAFKKYKMSTVETGKHLECKPLPTLNVISVCSFLIDFLTIPLGS